MTGTALKDIFKKEVIMRKVLHKEIKNEQCNAAAFGLFNSAVSRGYDEKINNEEEFKKINSETLKRGVFSVEADGVVIVIKRLKIDDESRIVFIDKKTDGVSFSYSINKNFSRKNIQPFLESKFKRIKFLK